jgi:hypothetical protein
MAIDVTSPRTRRAILLGALGATAASVAAAVGRANPVSAADGNTVHVGGEYTASSVTSFDTQNTDQTALLGQSTAVGVHGIGTTGGTGVRGASATGYGIFGASGSGTGVYGSSSTATAISGSSSASEASHKPAVLGSAHGNGTGVQGHSGTSSVPAAPIRTGVFGVANQDETSVGVLGTSGTGAGVRGQSTSGRGIVATGGAAQLRLVPSGAVSHPRSGLGGDLFLDKSKRLWLCQGGTHWTQIG